MPLSRAWAVALIGVEGRMVEVEADLADGLPTMVIVGLPDAAISESRDRLRAAVNNSGERWPARRITLGLFPASLPKHGSGFDLAMAATVLCASGAAPGDALATMALCGELALDGRVRPVRGVLPTAMAVARSGLSLIVAVDNLTEARLMPGLRVRAVRDLRGLLDLLRGRPSPEPDLPDVDPCDEPAPPDLADVAGQDLGRAAVEVAAAGGHHLFLVGPPGSGKTMLAERLPGLLPPLEAEEAIEVTSIHSVAGTLAAGCPLIRRPPFQAPHHTASVAALVGGGSGVARPGALSLAHRGVLFLDEAPEFASSVLDALRQPLERGEVVLARSGGLARYPARVQLVMAANPCPCSTPAGDTACTCLPAVRRRYTNRLSGPMLDRIDLQVDVRPARWQSLVCDVDRPESSAQVASRVRSARMAAAERWRPFGCRTNAQVPGALLRGTFRLPRAVTAYADGRLAVGTLSARGYDRVLRVAWSLADLAGRRRPDQDDVAEAYALRTRQAM